MTRYVDTVVMQTGDGFPAVGHRRRRFLRSPRRVDRDPRRVRRPPGGIRRLIRASGPRPRLRSRGCPSANSPPLAYESVVQYFDAEHAPDAAIMWSPQQMFHDCVGNHGSLGGIQARAPFIAAGPGIRPCGIVPEHLRTVDVAPTIAALGIPAGDGVDGRGRAAAGSDSRRRTATRSPNSSTPTSVPTTSSCFCGMG